MTDDTTPGEEFEETLDDIREAASQWIVRLEEADPEERDRQLAELDAWQQANPRRRRVVAQMRRMWGAVDSVRRDRRDRRHFAGLGIVLAAAFAIGQMPWAYWSADHRTGAGEIDRTTLSDGSEVVLNSNSAINVARDGDRRVVHLVRGEIMVRVNSDADGRDFAVHSPHGSARALGTRYSVRVAGDHTVVAVHESTVELVARDAPADATRLAAGQRAHLTPTGGRTTGSAPTGQPDWVEGRLVFNDAPLGEVIDRLARHRTGLLLFRGEPAKAQLRFTGVLPADDSDTALAVLTDALDLRVRRATPYLVWLERRR